MAHDGGKRVVEENVGSTRNPLTQGLAHRLKPSLSLTEGALNSVQLM